MWSCDPYVPGDGEGVPPVCQQSSVDVLEDPEKADED